jgi:hypothetical protein
MLITFLQTTGVTPQRLLSPESVLQSPNRDPMVLEIDILDGEHERFAHAQAVVVDQTEESSVARGPDCREEMFELILGEIFGHGNPKIIIASFADKV